MTIQSQLITTLAGRGQKKMRRKGGEMAERRLYLQLFSIHGLLRGRSPELGRDADTGGQITYVLDLVRALSLHPEVERIDLITRLIEDKTVAGDYAEPTEPLTDKARIVRIQCGGRKYMRKELLWPHLDEFADKTLRFVKSEGRTPDFFHGHYADGGYVARNLASIFGLPFVFTGHSLGRHKKNRLRAEGLSEEEVNRRYHIDYRIRVEEECIKAAEQIIASTSHEVQKQYGLYDSFRAGRYTIIPPGIDIEKFFPYYDQHFDSSIYSETIKQVRVALLHELHRFWVDSHKPFILAICRPDQRKNIAGLITAYGEDRELRAMANLAVFAGIRKNILGMEDNERSVFTEMLLLMDRYDLYGKLAIPKKHDFALEVPELYRLCAESRGVFVNPALVEPFGLTLIEAAATGLPIVATNDGGPTDIIANCGNGILIDPNHPAGIAEAVKKIIADSALWDHYSRNGIIGVRRHYSWAAHCEKTVTAMVQVQQAAPDITPYRKKMQTIGHRFTRLEKLVISDIDNTLIGDSPALKELLVFFRGHRDRIGWGVATGRCFKSTLAILDTYDIPKPDVIITSVGTEIHYGPRLDADQGWIQHLNFKWRPEGIRETLAEFAFLHLQEDENQQPFKISYYMDDNPALLATINQALQKKRLRYHLVYSHGQFLDILPFRASKGKAIRYLSYKWDLPLADIVVCGDSGNDEDMLRGDTSAVVVGNYSRELEKLKGLRRTFFSDRKYAAGIIEGMVHYGLIARETQTHGTRTESLGG